MMKNLLPVVMNDQFERLAVIDDYSSFIWSTRYYTSGDFQLIVAVTPKNKNLFQEDYYIVRDDDDNVGVIENILVKRNEDAEEVFIITGRFLDAFLSRRIIAKQTTVNGNVDDCVEQLLQDNVIDPEDPDRQISNFIYENFTINQSMSAQYTGKNLLDTISNICKIYGIGYKVTLDAENNIVFQLYEGVDRTYDQTENPWVIFSDTYDNLLSSQYEENYKTIANAVLVAGEGEGLDRKTVWVSDGSSGIDRHEIFKDQRQIQSNDEMTNDEYLDLLIETGEESLTKYTTAFSGNVYFGSVTYKEDIGIGDLCVIQNDRWGIYINTRLVEVIESVNEAGEYSIIPTFGS